MLSDCRHKSSFSISCEYARDQLAPCDSSENLMHSNVYSSAFAVNNMPKSDCETKIWATAAPEHFCALFYFFSYSFGRGVLRNRTKLRRSGEEGKQRNGGKKTHARTLNHNRIAQLLGRCVLIWEEVMLAAIGFKIQSNLNGVYESEHVAKNI